MVKVVLAVPERLLRGGFLFYASISDRASVKFRFRFEFWIGFELDLKTRSETRLT